MRTSEDDDDQPTIGIVTAIMKELAAVRLVFGGCRKVASPSRKLYFRTNVTSETGGEHRVIVALLSEMGNNIAGITANQLFSDYPSIECVIMVGIAGAIPNHLKPDDHVRLGDIVVCSREGVVQFDLGKRHSNGTFESRGCSSLPSAAFLEIARQLEAGELLNERPWEKYIDASTTADPWKRPPIEKDVLLEGASPVQHPTSNRRAGYPKVFFGRIASSNTLLKDPILRDQLREQHSVKAVEMEASGISDAAHFAHRQYFIVRGTCDYCDARKNDDWQHYAAVIAASYVRALIEACPVSSPAPTVNKERTHSNEWQAGHTLLNKDAAQETLIEKLISEARLVGKLQQENEMYRAGASAYGSNLDSLNKSTQDHPDEPMNKVQPPMTVDSPRVNNYKSAPAVPSSTNSVSILERAQEISKTLITLIDNLELDKAFILLDTSKSWINAHAAELPQLVRRQIYLLSAKIEALKYKSNRNDKKALEEAIRFMELARQ